MANVDNFQVNKKQGDECESTIRRWLKQFGWEVGAYNKKEDMQYHVDIEAWGVLGQHALIDVKHDSYIGLTQNIPFEDRPNKVDIEALVAAGKPPRKQGWGVDPNVKADYIFIGDMQQKEQQHPQFWIFRLVDQQDFNKHHWDGKRRNTKGNCALFPMKDFAKHFCYFHVDNDWKLHRCGNTDVAWELGE